MKFYILNLRVAEDALGETITAVTPLIGAGRAMLGQIVPEVVTPAPVREKRTHKSSSAAETRLGRIVMTALATGSCTSNEVGAMLAEAGFSSGSASPILSKLVSEGVVTRGTTSLNGRESTVYSLHRPTPTKI